MSLDVQTPFDALLFTVPTTVGCQWFRLCGQRGGEAIARSEQTRGKHGSCDEVRYDFEGIGRVVRTLRGW